MRRSPIPERRNRRALDRAGAGLAALAGVLFGLLAPALPAQASSVTSASFSGGAGTAVVGSTLFARQGANLTLTVLTSTDTRCVVVSGAFAATQTSSTAKSSWTFSSVAGGGDGASSVTVTASPKFNQNTCTGQSGTGTASYVRDNTAPVLTYALSPAPDADGWNNSNVDVAWSAADIGAGLAGSPSPAADKATGNGSMTMTSTATDRVGNAAAASVTIKIDRTPPKLVPLVTTPANANGWHNTDVLVQWQAADDESGVDASTVPAPATISTEGVGQSAKGDVKDKAKNQTAAEVSVNVDKSPPSLTVPADATVETTNAAGAALSFGALADDTLSGLDRIECSPAPGSTFPVGTTTVTCSATDKADNQKVGSFNVTVRDNRCDAAQPTTGSDTNGGAPGTPGHNNPACSPGLGGGGGIGGDGGGGPSSLPELNSLLLFVTGAAAMGGARLRYIGNSARPRRSVGRTGKACTRTARQLGGVS